MATYVLVHGGGHGGWCYDRVAPRLRAQGHTVHAPTLTGLAERAHEATPETGLDTHIDDVVRLLEGEDLHDVILAGHSYGGMVITGVADRAGDRIGQLVFLDAAMPVDGDNLFDAMPKAMGQYLADAKTVDGIEWAMFPTPETPLFLGVTDPADVEWMLPLLTPHPFKSMTDHLHLTDEAAVRRIPRTHINCTPMNAFIADEPELWDRRHTADRVWEIDTLHDLMITEPVQLAEMLARLAER